MKKLLLIGATLALATIGWAQKSRMRDARDYLSDNNYKKAIPTMNEVVANGDTKDNAEAWYLRGMAYLQAAIDSTSGVANAADESYTSLQKAIALKPDYPKEINNALYSNAIISFNKGVEAYRKEDYSNAYDAFIKAVNIYKINGGQRFAGDAGFATLIESAKSNAAFCAFYSKRDDAALPLLEEIRTTPGTNDSNIYAAIVEVYQRQKKDEQALATIAEARKKFPSNQQFRNLELNYYISSGKQDALLSKLVDAVAADPNNAELQFNLGNAYERAAFPKDANGKAGAKPANFDELFGKAESAYAKSLAPDANNPTYNYNAGVLYYERASVLNNEMNAIEGLTASDKKKYDALLSDRNKYFDRAIPYFENANKVLGGKDKLSTDDKITYQSAMIGLRQIYSLRDRMVEANALKAKIDALK